MVSTLSRIRTYFEGFPAQGPGTLRRAIVVHAFAPVAIVLSSVYAALSFSDPDTRWIGVLLLVTLAALLVSLQVLRRTKKLLIASHALVALALPIQLAWLDTGGFFGDGFAWTIAWVPWAFLLVGRRAGLVWVGVLAGSALLLVGLDGAGVVTLAYRPGAVVQVLFMVVVASSLLFIYDQQVEHFERTSTRAFRDLQLERDKLAVANQELEAFTYSVSHDLRAPLRAMEGFSRVLLEDHAAELSGEAERRLGIVVENVGLMSTLVDDLLRFSRLGRQALRREPVDPGDVVAEVLEDLRAETSDREVEIEVGELPACVGDRGLLKVVYANLVSNALKFSRGREPARIRIGAEPRDRRPPAYFVQDNGVGFDPTFSDKLFGVFQRLHRVDEFEGTGVGLATVHRIVLRHGGRVWADSTPGNGATFWFTLKGEADDA